MRIKNHPGQGEMSLDELIECFDNIAEISVFKVPVSDPVACGTCIKTRRCNVDYEIIKVDAKPVRHGRWIGYPECLQYDNAIDDSYIVCSVCKEPFNIIDNDTERFDYCPHCGADMRGEKE